VNLLVIGSKPYTAKATLVLMGHTVTIISKARLSKNNLKYLRTKVFPGHDGLVIYPYNGDSSLFITKLSEFFTEQTSLPIYFCAEDSIIINAKA